MAEREIIGLSGGPRDGHWYWLDEWHGIVRAAKRMGHTTADGPGNPLGYHPSNRQAPCPHPPLSHRVGVIWIWTGKP